MFVGVAYILTEEAGLSDDLVVLQVAACILLDTVKYNPVCYLCIFKYFKTFMSEHVKLLFVMCVKNQCCCHTSCFVFI